MLKASTRRVARLKTFTHLESWVPACDCQCPPQAQAPPSVKQLPIPGFKGTKFQKCDCVWPIMILERFIFNKVNIGNCSLLAPSRRLLSGNASDDTWRLKSSYGWFLPVQTRSNQNVKIALHRGIKHKQCVRKGPQLRTWSSWGPNCWNGPHLVLIQHKRSHFPHLWL